MKKIFSIILIIILLPACGENTPSDDEYKKLNHIEKQQTNIDGSLMILDGGIMVLADEEKNRIHSTILVASSDSIKEIAQCSYDERIDNGCYIDLKSWVSFSGYYLRNDTLRSIFAYSGLKILDDCSACTLASDE